MPLGQVEAEAVGQQAAQAHDAMVADLAEELRDDVAGGVVLVAKQQPFVKRVVAAFDADGGDGLE